MITTSNFVYSQRKEGSFIRRIFNFSLEMPRWCIAYGCNNSYGKGNTTSWHRLPLDDPELLSKWLAKIRRTNTPVKEHSRICGDHFEASCFVRCPGSSRTNLRTGSVPTKFIFVQETSARKPPAERKPIQERQSGSKSFVDEVDEQVSSLENMYVMHLSI